jgi:GTP cyclohydrolase I
MDLNGTDAQAVENSVNKKDAEDAVRTLLRYVGEGIGRDGPVRTPARVVRSFEELLCGAKEDPQQFLSTVLELKWCVKLTEENPRWTLTVQMHKLLKIP